MSGDYVERLRTVLAAPDRYITGRVVVVPSDLHAALAELEQLRATVAARPLDPARKHCLLCGHYFLAHRRDIGCMHCQCTAGVTIVQQPEPCPCGCEGSPDECTCGGACRCGNDCPHCDLLAYDRAQAAPEGGD